MKSPIAYPIFSEGQAHGRRDPRGPSARLLADPCQHQRCAWKPRCKRSVALRENLWMAIGGVWKWRNMEAIMAITFKYLCSRTPGDVFYTFLEFKGSNENDELRRIDQGLGVWFRDTGQWPPRVGSWIRSHTFRWDHQALLIHDTGNSHRCPCGNETLPPNQPMPK